MVADREEVDVGLTICAVEAHKAARKTTQCNENILTTAIKRGHGRGGKGGGGGRIRKNAVSKGKVECERGGVLSDTEKIYWDHGGRIPFIGSTH